MEKTPAQWDPTARTTVSYDSGTNPRQTMHLLIDTLPDLHIAQLLHLFIAIRDYWPMPNGRTPPR